MDGFPTLGIPDTGDTAWMLASSALVLLMTPGLAFFYGGMVRAKSVLNMIMMSVSAMGVVTVLWVLYGYSWPSATTSVEPVRRPDAVLRPEGPDRRQRRRRGDRGPGSGCRSRRGGEHPAGRHVACHRVRRVPADVRDHHRRPDLRRGRRPAQVRRLAGVRRPVGHGRLLPGRALGVLVRRRHRRDRRLDRQQARGNRLRRWYRGPHQRRCRRLVLALDPRQAQGLAGHPMRPHNLPFVMLGAGLLWFGWYGFNAGSAALLGRHCRLDLRHHHVATAAAMLAWLLAETIRDGKATSLGAASGIVAGLVAITPSCSSVNVLGALVIGVVAGAAVRAGRRPEVQTGLSTTRSTSSACTWSAA